MNAAIKLDEIWKPIDKYPGSFVSNMGRIKSSNGERKFYKNPGGYFVLCMSYKGKCRTEFVHQLVAETFISNPLKERTINHINGIKTDNRVINLERCSYGDNLRHAYRTGLKRTFHKAPSAKLDGLSARVIRDCHQFGASKEQLATYFKVQKKSISQVIAFKSYRNEPACLR